MTNDPSRVYSGLSQGSQVLELVENASILRLEKCSDLCYIMYNAIEVYSIIDCISL